MKSEIKIIIVLDRSGSMSSVVNETIGGFNSFLNEQKTVEGYAIISLIQFDHEFEIVYDAIPLQEAQALSKRNYVPRGTTALLDAIGKTIELTRKSSKNSVQLQTKPRIIFVIITDGHENSSIHFSRKKIFASIRKMEEKHQWQFVYIGANQDAIEEASKLGVSQNKALTFYADEEGTNVMFSILNDCVSECRVSDREFDFDRKKEN